MRYLLVGAVWVALYLAVVLAPLVFLFLGRTPPPGGVLRDFATVLGFAGLAMAGVQFALTARFKRATAPFGIDVIYYFHRYAAVIAFLLILAHAVLLLVEDPAPSEYLDPRAAPLHMTSGVLATLAFAAVVATSLWRRQLRLHYDGWRLAHGILASLAVILALVHLHGVGNYTADPWKRGFWTVLALAWVAVLGYVRVVRPWKLARRPYRVVSVSEERGDAWTLAVEPVGHAGFDFQPGQFAWVSVRRSTFSMGEHPFSIASAPRRPGGLLEFTIKELGDFTRTIRTLRAGEVVHVDGPYGAFSIDRHPAAGYVLIAGGIGIAPLMSMVRAVADRGDRRPITLVYAYRRWERLTFREELEKLRETLGLRLVFVLDEPPEGWTGERGRITAELLARHVPDRRGLEFFVCGPMPMIRNTELALHQLGVPLRHVRSELFDLV